jgi:uncharacterized protein YodC (DUF2158 family)
MTTKFKIGDTVKLKSGSPVMTITNTKVWKRVEKKLDWDETYAECTWFDIDNKSHTKEFPKDALEKIND